MHCDTNNVYKQMAINCVKQAALSSEILHTTDTPIHTPTDDRNTQISAAVNYLKNCNKMDEEREKTRGIKQVRVHL